MNRMAKMVFMVAAAMVGSISIAVSVANAGLYGPLTSTEVENICTRCESKGAKQESVVYVREEGYGYSVNCTTSFAYCVFYPELAKSNPSAKADINLCDKGDLSIKNTWMVMLDGKKVEISKVYYGAEELNDLPYPKPPVKSVAWHVSVCANISPNPINPIQ